MHLRLFVPAVALFLVSSTSAINAAQEEALNSHQIVARSSSLLMRQAMSDLGACQSKCAPVKTMTFDCGPDIACLCASSLSVPFHDCAECVYSLVTDTAVKTQLIDSYNNYVEACKESKYPITGDTTIGDSPSSSSSSPSPSSSSSSSGLSKGNSAVSLSSGLAVTLGLPAAAIVASALFL
ncbi:hypothetical protein M407DRAFT_28818 [Tulasnella calospora MUT 4182]|uniref:Extracellular membrane protein CFEM domain-containing protein n=1 Tax=Tulasnella calospora MUT 4182 TaxID=1051891 RepID=A0A0C3QBA7_9AGAM|nr:hypothetical protein M407DRAFT_28818 [Tulasnella calospora MUT 4182]